MHHEQMLAARAITRVFEGANLRDALVAVDDGNALRGRTLVQELAYGTLRHWGTLDALSRELARKPIPDPLLRSLVAIALYQLEHTRAPAFAIVDRAVEAAGTLVRPAAKSLANAMLRRFLRERSALREAVRRMKSRAGRIRNGGSTGCGATIRTTGEAILDAGNAPPAAHAARKRACRDAERRCSSGLRSPASGQSQSARRA